MEQQQSYSPRTLQDLVPGQSGMILSVGNQSGAVKRRLVDMGLTPGTTVKVTKVCLLYTSPSPRDGLLSRMPSSA